MQDACLHGNSLAVTTSREKTQDETRRERVFDSSKYSTRLVAFKIAYLGKRYNGFEYHKGNWTPLPTVEEELWKAFYKARLIFPDGADALEPGDISWDGTDYTKCGRTDKGVSAFGQVIGIRVRSNRPLRKSKKADANGGIGSTGNMLDEGCGDIINALPNVSEIKLADPSLRLSSGGAEEMNVAETNFADPEYEDVLNFDPIKDELSYCQVLNRLLPPDIRVLAWCPSPPLNFSARFSCRERRYRYFFTQPAFSPIPDPLQAAIQGASPGQTKTGWLNIEAMRDAAKLFEGVHDFRNFCKVDGSKQITNFEREIFHSSIEEVEDYTGTLAYLNDSGLRPAGSSDCKNPKVYTFNLHGSAFLWHQVRHMVAILFLIGQGLEKPSVISELLDVKTNPTRPTYEMAADTPLVLWDCIFPREGDDQRKDAMHWLYVGDGIGNWSAKYENKGLMDGLWKNWREAKIDEMLAGSLMSIVANQGDRELSVEGPNSNKQIKSQKIFEGADVPRSQGQYKPVMKKPRMEDVETINKKYAVRKGFETPEDLRGYRKLKLSAER
jgi:tRNA pseudouridine38/39 synthase